MARREDKTTKSVGLFGPRVQILHLISTASGPPVAQEEIMTRHGTLVSADGRIEALLARRIRRVKGRKIHEYLVRWKGYTCTFRDNLGTGEIIGVPRVT